MEPSVDPLSATTTSPFTPKSWKAARALSMQNAIDSASFRQGITTETSTSPAGDADPLALIGWVSDFAWVIEMYSLSSPKYSGIMRQFLVMRWEQASGLEGGETGRTFAL